MRKFSLINLLIISFLLMSPQLYAQLATAKLTLVVIDSLTNVPLEYATVEIRNKGESESFRYTLSNGKGKVDFPGIKKGSYEIEVSYVGYQSKIKNYELESLPTSVIDLGIISMVESVMKISDVKVEIDAVTMKDDSILYNASAYDQLPSDYLEDLLKKMPGLEVIRGKILYNGKPITKVTVEGRQFFDGDNSIALQNLPAYAIKQISVHNRKTVKGTFSGMDTRDEPLEIDVKLKDNMKTGTIGNLLGGYGTEDKYRGKGFVGRFASEGQYAVIAEANNTSTTITPTTTVKKGKATGLELGNDMLGFSKSNSVGIVEAISTGGDYCIEKKNEEKNSINTVNANISYKGTDGFVEELSKRETYLKDNIQYYNKTEQQNDKIDNISFSGRNVHRKSVKGFAIDGNATISYQKQKSDKSNKYNTLFENVDIANNSGNSRDKFDGGVFDGTANLMIIKSSPKKMGRFITIELNANYQNSDNRLNNRSETEFHTNDSTIVSSVDTKHRSKGDAFSLNSQFRMGEVFNHLEHEFKINLSYNNFYEVGTSDKSALQYNDETSKYDIIDQAATGYIRSEFIEHKVTFSLSYRFKTKLTATAGLSYIPSILRNEDSFQRRELETEWEQNLSPHLKVFKDFERCSLELTYNGKTKQPTMEQLQPIENNTNPLFVKQGNLNLKPEFINNLKFGIKKRTSNIELMASFVKKKIIYKSEIDEMGINYSSPINEDGIWNATGNYSLYHSFPNKITITNRLSANYYHNIGYTNEEKYSSDTYAASDRLSVRYNGKTINAQVIASVQYAKSNYSLNTMDNESTWTNSIGGDINLSLPFKMNILADYAYTFYRGFKYDNQPSSILNIEISKQLFRNKCALSIKAYDIFNESKNVKVAYGEDYVQEWTNNTIKRYFMANFSWRFGKFGH